MNIKCVCPPKPDGTRRHESDEIVLKDHLDFRSAVSIRNAVSLLKSEDPDASTADVLAALTEGYVLNGIESWSLVDAKNKPLEPSRANIRAFLEEHLDEAMEVANEADSMYMESVMLPLVVRGLSSSSTTPTASSTSQPTGSKAEPRKPSKPSSTSTLPTEDIETTSESHDGDSSSSRRLKSVG